MAKRKKDKQEEERKQKIKKTKTTLLAENQVLMEKLEYERKVNEESQKLLIDAQEADRDLKKSIPAKTWTEMVKTSLLAFLITICSIGWLWLGCFNETSEPVDMCLLGTFVIFAAGLVLIILEKDDLYKMIFNTATASALIGILADRINTTTMSWFVHYPLFIALTALTLFAVVFAGYNRRSNIMIDKHLYDNFTYLPSTVMLIIFATITLLGTIPLSRYHNMNQLKRDERLAEILQINRTEQGIEVILPAEHISEQRYLENVLSVFYKREEPNESSRSWKTKSIFCKEGEKEWYKLPVLALPAGDITLFFDHVWDDYEKIIKVPVP